VETAFTNSILPLLIYRELILKTPPAASSFLRLIRFIYNVGTYSTSLRYNSCILLLDRRILIRTFPIYIAIIVPLAVVIITPIITYVLGVINRLRSLLI